MHPFYGPSGILLEGGSLGWAGLLSMAIYLIFWAVVIAVAIRFAKKYMIGKQRSQDDPAVSILRQRYAKGEIDAAQFKDMLAVLKGSQESTDRH